MKNDEWVTYEYYGRSGNVMHGTRRRGELANHRKGRPATEAEIAAEVSRREVAEKEREKDRAFQAREDYRFANIISSRIEFMTADDNPLDAMTVEEWEKLAKLLSGS